MAQPLVAVGAVQVPAPAQDQAVGQEVELQHHYYSDSYFCPSSFDVYTVSPSTSTHRTHLRAVGSRKCSRLLSRRWFLLVSLDVLLWRFVSEVGKPEPQKQEA